MTGLADLVNFILEENNLTTTSLIGHSMGGYIGLAFTEKYLSKVNTIVLLNSTTEKDSIERKSNRERALKIVSTNKNIFIKTLYIASKIQTSHYILWLHRP